MTAAFVALAALGWGGGCTVEVEDVPVLVDYYDPCVFDEDCPLDTYCYDVEVDYGTVIVGDAMCTVACRNDFDCPFDGLCLGTAFGPPLCYEPCFDDFDCPVRFGCVQDVGLVFFEPVCMPI